MKEWISITISVISLFIIMAGGVWYMGHADEKLQHLAEQQKTTELRMDKQFDNVLDKLDDVEDRVAIVEGYLKGMDGKSIDYSQALLHEDIKND